MNMLHQAAVEGSMSRKDGKGRILRSNEVVRPDGRYVYQYYDLKGNRKRVYSWRLVETDPVPKGKAWCESLREMEKVILKDQMDGIETKSKLTLNDQWDADIADKPELKQSTRTNYRYMYDKYIRDDIGKMLIKSITYSDCKRFFNKLIHERGFKPSSVEIINTLLHPVFRIAVRDNVIRTNPIDGIIAELKRSNDWVVEKRHALTKEQQTAFVNYVRNHEVYGHWYPLIICLLGTGCRVGEMLGLRWEDVFWNDGYISIDHSLIYRQQDDGSCRFRVTTTKTRNSDREIPMFGSVRKALKEEYARQCREGFCEDEIEGYSGFIWMNCHGHVFSPHNLNRALDRITRDYNAEEKVNAKKEHRKPELLPHFSAHHLRHTFCTRICEEETDLKLIQEIMGHADITTTMDIYNESNMDRKRERFARLEKIANVF